MTFTPRRKLSVGEKTKGTSKVFTLGSTGQTSYDTFLNDAFKKLKRAFHQVYLSYKQTKRWLFFARVQNASHLRSLRSFDFFFEAV